MPHFRKKPIDIVIDVRSKIEFWLGHLEGAECIPLQSLPNALEKRRDIDKGARILLYCASGARSAAALVVLRDAGYRHVTDGGAMSRAAADFTP